MSIRIENSLSEEKWRNFVLKHPKGNVFHTPEMYQVFQRTKGFVPELWAAIDNERVLALFLPVQISLANGLTSYLTTRSVSYGSVLCLPETSGREALSLLLQVYKREADQKSLFTELRNISSLEEVQPILNEQDFIYEDHLNYLIDLDRSPDDVFQDIGKRTRKNIRNGLNKGEVDIIEVVDHSKISDCYKLLQNTYQLAQVPLADQTLFQAAFDLLYPKTMVRFTLALVEEIPIAVSVELLYKDVMYGWYGGMDREYGSHVPNELLMWHLLEWGAEHDYRQYDFGGAGKPDEDYGVRRFKAKFGGDLVCYGRNIWVSSPLILKLSKFGYSLLRRHVFNLPFI